MPSEPRLQRWLRFARAVVVGSGATIADFSVFEACVRGIGMAPTAARLPALLTGACLQFFGNRGYTFRAQAGNLSRQASLFAIAEGITLALNFGTFHLLVTWFSAVPPELLGFLGTFLVFVAFAYPVRRWVIFSVPSPDAAGSERSRATRSTLDHDL